MFCSPHLKVLLENHHSCWKGSAMLWYSVYLAIALQHTCMCLISVVFLTKSALKDKERELHMGSSTGENRTSAFAFKTRLFTPTWCLVLVLWPGFLLQRARSSSRGFIVLSEAQTSWLTIHKETTLVYCRVTSCKHTLPGVVFWIVFSFNNNCRLSRYKFFFFFLFYCLNKIVSFGHCNSWDCV